MNSKRQLMEQNYRLAHEFVDNYLNKVCKSNDKDDISNLVVMVVADFIDKAMVEMKPLLKNSNYMVDSNIVLFSIAKSMNSLSNSIQEALLWKDIKH